MILAAGEGQRFRPHTEILPKPALPFCGYPLLYYSLFQLQKLEISKLVLNTFHLPDQIVKLSQSLPSCFKYPIEISNEKSFGKLLGSGGGIGFAQRHLCGEGPFLVLNGDEVILPFEPNFMSEFLKFFSAQSALGCLLTTNHPEAGKKFGAVWVDDSFRVRGFGKTPPSGIQKLRPLHFLGTQVYDEKIFSFIKPNSESNILYDALAGAIAVGEIVSAYNIDCHWYETGNLADYLVATHNTLKLIKTNFKYLNEFYQHLGSEYSLKEVNSHLVLLHKMAVLSHDVKIDGFVVAGADSRVESFAKLKNTILNKNYHVTSSAQLSDGLFL